MRTAGPLLREGTEDRLLAKVAWNGDEEECWTWEGARDKRGYGRFRLEGGSSLAHRAAYELFVGPVPQGLSLDHVCRNTSCVNPAHLEPVTPAVNVLRSDAGWINNAQSAKTHCPHGHPYSGSNLRIDLTNRRRCRTCHRNAQRRYRNKGR